MNSATSLPNGNDNIPFKYVVIIEPSTTEILVDIILMADFSKSPNAKFSGLKRAASQQKIGYLQTLGLTSLSFLSMLGKYSTWWL